MRSRYPAFLLSVLFIFGFSVSSHAESVKKQNNTASMHPAIVRHGQKSSSVPGRSGLQGPNNHSPGVGGRPGANLPGKYEPAMGRGDGMRQPIQTPGHPGGAGQGNKNNGISQFGKEAQLKNAIDGKTAGLDMSGKQFGTARNSPLKGGDGGIPEVGRETIGRDAGRNQTSKSEQLGDNGLRGGFNDRDQGDNHRGSGSKNDNNGGNDGGNRWHGDRTSYDRADHASAGNDGGSSGEQKQEARDPVYGMTHAEAQAEADKQNRGDMTETELHQHEENIRQENRAGMNDQQLNDYAAQNKREDSGQGDMTDKEFKEYQERIKKEDEAQRNGSMPIPDEIAEGGGHGAGMTPEESERLRQRKVSLTDENKRQLDKVHVELTAKDIRDRRTSGLTNPVDGRDGNTTGTGGGGTLTGGQKSPNNPTGRPVGGHEGDGSGDPPPGDPSD